jgi:hypothetical protein
MKKTLINSLRNKKKSLNNTKRKSKRLIKRLSKRVKRKYTKRKYTKRKHQLKIKDRGSAKKGKKKSTNQGQSSQAQSQSQTNASAASTANSSARLSKNFFELTIKDFGNFKDNQFKKRESFSTLLINLGFQNTYGDEALHVYTIKVEGNGVFEGEEAQFGIRISKQQAAGTLITERKNDLLKTVLIKEELVNLMQTGELINASGSKLASLGFSQARRMIANRDASLAEQQTGKVSKISLKSHLEDIQKMIEKNSSKKTGMSDQPEPESEFSQTAKLTSEQIEEKFKLDQQKLLKQLKKNMVKEEEISLRKNNIRTYIELQFTLISSQIPSYDLETIKEGIIIDIESEFDGESSRGVIPGKLITPENGWNKYSKIYFKPYKKFLTLFYPINGPHIKSFRQALNYFTDNFFVMLMTNKFAEVNGLYRLFVSESITSGLVDISKKNEMLYKGLPIYTNNKSFIYFENDKYKVPGLKVTESSYPKMILSLTNPTVAVAPNFIVKCTIRNLIPKPDEKSTLLGVNTSTGQLFSDNVTFITSRTVDIDPALSDENNAAIVRDIFSRRFLDPIIAYLSPELVKELNIAISTENIPEEYLIDLVTRIKTDISRNSTEQIPELGSGWEVVNYIPDEPLEPLEPLEPDEVYEPDEPENEGMIINEESLPDISDLLLED